MLQVVGAGLSRTGTYSLKLALEMLGFDPCYHMHEVLTRPDHVRVWSVATRTSPCGADSTCTRSIPPPGLSG